MSEDKDLQGLSVRQLRARRRRLAATLVQPEATLPGTLTRQGRRCSSAGCRCRSGELHGPYLYLALYSEGRSRTLYVPAVLEAAVEEHVNLARRNDALRAEIGRINIALFERRALG